MKGYLILLPIFLLALIQGTFLPLNLVLLVILFWVVLRPVGAGKEIFWLAFLAGLILDLAKGTPLGFSSLYFLIFTLALILYSRKFDPLQPLFLIVLAFLAESFWDFLANGFFNWKRGLVSAAIVLFFRLIIKTLLFSRPRNVGGKK